MKKKVFFIFTLFLFVNIVNTLDWRYLDSTNLQLKNDKPRKLGAYDPNPNSTITLGNQIDDSFEQEESLWSGTINKDVETPTWTYLKAMSSLTTTMENFIRRSYKTIFADLAIETCNSISTPAEIIIDINQGFGPNSITYNDTELNLLIPQHRCVLPSLPNGVSEPTFDDLRKHQAIYKAFLSNLGAYIECILVVNAFPSYTKGVSCMEDYYYGTQDAGSNPQFFDLMANSVNLGYAIQDFIESDIPDDISLYNATTWTDFQYLLGVSRQYKEIARKIRYTTILVYNALSRNYVRLHRLKSCQQLENTTYTSGINTQKFWCNFTNCYQDTHNFSLLCNSFPNGHPLEPGSGQICETNVCGPQETYPDPFYCDSNRDCPNAYYCSLISRKCYKSEYEKPTFARSYNKTVCGYSRRLADASAIIGHVNGAFGGSVNESTFSFKTYWPQNCSLQIQYFPVTNQPDDIGPYDIPEICYPLTSNSIFYSNGTANCSVLGDSYMCYDVSYTKYIDGIDSGVINETICINRTSIGSESWQIAHCTEDGLSEPLVYPNITDYTISSTDSTTSTNEFSSSTGGNTGSLSNLPLFFSVGSIYGETNYMGCPNNDTDCVTQNSTHVCFHNVIDIVRVFSRFISSSAIVCTDQRVYGTPTNVTYNYVEPDVGLFPPTTMDKPTDYLYFGYFKISHDAFNIISPGSATITNGPLPINMTEGEKADFLGYYTLTNQNTNTWKLLGKLTFYVYNTSDCLNVTTQQGCNITQKTVEGNDYFLTLKIGSTLGNCSLNGLVVNNITGQLVYNPVTDIHPNNRFNDPNECYFLEVSVLATVPMIRSPAPAPRRYKDFWMAGVTAVPFVPNLSPALNPCAAIFMRKILYVSDSQWFDTPSTDYQQGVEDGIMRYTCARSLSMEASCSHFGVPIRSASYENIFNNVNPPIDGSTNFVL